MMNTWSDRLSASRWEVAGIYLYSGAMTLPGLYQILQAELSVVIMPRWNTDSALYPVLSYVVNALLIVSGLMILCDLKRRIVALAIGILLPSSPILADLNYSA